MGGVLKRMLGLTRWARRGGKDSFVRLVGIRIFRFALLLESNFLESGSLFQEDRQGPRG